MQLISGQANGQTHWLKALEIGVADVFGTKTLIPTVKAAILNSYNPV